MDVPYEMLSERQRGDVPVRGEVIGFRYGVSVPFETLVVNLVMRHHQNLANFATVTRFVTMGG